MQKKTAVCASYDWPNEWVSYLLLARYRPDAECLQGVFADNLDEIQTID